MSQFLSQQKMRHKTQWPLAILAFVLMSTAYASQSLHYKTISENQLESAFSQMSIGHSQRAVKTEVAKTIEWIINSPEQKKRFLEALKRMQTHEKFIEQEMQQYGLPKELKAIILDESGAQNLPPQKGIFERSTGMWQIIGKTARTLGLTVTPQMDERQDVHKATNAAVRYLAMNRARFDNLDLSILAYNAGENAVGQAIQKASSKDPMDVRQHLMLETQYYYLKVLAAVVLMNNPSLLN